MPINSFADPVYDAIKAFMVANWAATPVQWPNEEYTSEGDTAFVKVAFHGTIYGQESIGAEVQADNRWDREGVLWLYLSVPRNTSFSNASGAALGLANLFRGLTLLSGSLEFLDANIGVNHFGDEEGAWYLVPVSIEWRHMNA